jgi:uncharacterized protein (DUF1778 family)
MEEKTAFLTARITPSNKALLKARAALRGLTVSELLHEDYLNKTLQPLREAVLAEVEVGNDPDAA